MTSYLSSRACCVCGERTLVSTPCWPDGVKRNACWGMCLEVARERIVERQGQDLCDRLDRQAEAQDGPRQT